MPVPAGEELPSEFKEVNKLIQGTNCICILHSEDVDILESRHESTLVELRRMNPPFAVREAGESGYGMFADRAMQTGDLIWEERPLVIIPDELVSNVWASISRRIGTTTREAILDLRDAHPSDVDALEGSLRTNFIGIELSPTATTSYRALFPIISRANHSCCSNATYFFNTTTMALELRAARNILSNEEIHIQYIDVLIPKSQRQQALQRLYFFWCQCPSCIFQENSPEHIQSDLNRRRLKDWYGEHVPIQQWLDDASIPASLVQDDALELIDLINTESLEVIQRFALDLLCACLAALGDEEQFGIWAQKARAASRMGGDGHPMVLYYDKALVDPTSMHLWNARKVAPS